MENNNSTQSGQPHSRSTNLRAASDRIERLIEEIGQLGDRAVRDKSEELVRLVMELYGGAFVRMVDIIDESGAPGESLIHRLATDDLVASLLILHDLHPLDIETRVESALERVRPYLGSHGGDVKLLGVRQGIVFLRLEGSCHGCPSSTLTMKLAIEKAIGEAAPDVAGIEVEGQPDDKGAESTPLIGAAPNGRGAQHQRRIDTGQWIEVGGLPELAREPVTGREIGGLNVLICRLGETFFAYEDSCPSCRAALRNGALQQSILTCPSCGAGFDVCLAGQAVNANGLHMEPLPLLGREEGLRIAIPTANV